MPFYRFFFYYDVGRSEEMRDAGGTPTGVVTNTHVQFYVYDRLKDIKYATGTEFSHFATVMKSYISNLDKQRMLSLSK